MHNTITKLREFQKELSEINKRSVILQKNIQEYLVELENHKELNQISYAEMEEEFANCD